MPTITFQPSISGFHSAYGTSLVYTVTQSYTSGDPLPALKAEISVGGSLFSTVYIQPDSSTPTLATFQLDISAIVQEYFRVTYSYRAFSGVVNSTVSAIPTVSVKFYAWIANADGLLEEDASTATSSTIRVINSADADVADFYASSGRRFLTNKPDRYPMFLGETDIVVIYMTVAGYIEIKTYNSGGIQGTYRKNLSGSSTRLCIFGVGPGNLSAGISWDYEDTPGGDVVDGGDSTYYTIQVFTSGGTAISELRTYYYDSEGACEKYRIEFFNRLGCWDTVTVYGDRDDYYDINSQVFESPVTEINAMPVRRLYTERQDKFRIQFFGGLDATYVWLKELAGTPAAYLTDSSTPIVVSDITGAVEKRTGEQNTLTLECVKSTKVRSQRN